MTFRTVLSILAAAGLLAGCVAPSIAPPPAPGTRLEEVNLGIDRGATGGTSSSATEYVIEPPDEIAIDVRGEPDLCVEALLVEPDGRVHRPLVGSVDVAGRTAAEVAADLRRRYERYIRDVDVAVRVVAFRSKHVYVTGEVRSPGRYPYTGGDHVLDVLAQAGFLTANADSDGIEVARAARGFTARLPVRLQDILERGDGSTNWQLEPGDVIRVAPGLLARVGYVVRDVLSPLAVPVRVHSGD